jgi:hypothetical protein
MLARMKPSGRIAVALVAAASLLAIAETAAADTLTIRRPGSHPDYVFEAEPHLLLGFIDPPGPDVDDDFGFGPGFRGTIELVDNGFVSTINNTIGIGFGADFVIYPGATQKCRSNRGACVLEDDDVTYVWFPLVMQWNFWLSRNWSVFGEPGVAFRMVSPGDDKFQPLVFFAGGRFHFSDFMTLTMRVGYPAFSVGVSFLL